MTTQATKEELAQHEIIQTEIAKLIAETSKINSNNRWYPAIISASMTLAIIAVAKMCI
jgi:hypothetical protein